MKKRIFSIMTAVIMLLNLMPMTMTAQAAGCPITVGEYVQMGKYYGAPILWRCVAFEKIAGYDASGNPIIDSTDTRTTYANGYLPLMLADRILCLKAFDAWPSGNTATESHSHGRERYESNYWADSNIRSWLNSTAGAGKVKWLCGDPPVAAKVTYNPYDREAGFLSGFSSAERAAMKSVTQKSILSYLEDDRGLYTEGSTYIQYESSISDVAANYNTAYAERVTDKMFLLDVRQIQTVYENGGLLGNDYYIGTPTPEAVSHSEYKSSDLNATTKWWFWLRSPTAYYSRDVRHVYSDGDVYDYYGYGGHGGVRPAFYFNLTSLNLSGGRGSASDPYTLNGSDGAAPGKTVESLSDDSPVIRSAKLKRNGKQYDILTQKVSVNVGSSETFSIKLDIDWKGIPASRRNVLLTQGDFTQKNNTLIYQFNDLDNTIENLKIGYNFKPDEPIYLIASDKTKPDKRTVSVKTKLNVTDPKNDDTYQSIQKGKWDFKLGQDISLTIPENIGVFGGMQLTWKLDFIPVTVAYESDGTLAVVIGVDGLVTEGKDEELKFKDFNFTEFKNAIKDYRDGIGKAYSKQNRTLKELRSDARMKKAAQLKKPLTNSMWDGKVLKSVGKGDSDFSIDCTGYAEVKKRNGKLDFNDVEGYIELMATVSYEYKGQVFLWVIPCYYKIGGEFSAGLKGVINALDSSTFEPSISPTKKEIMDDADPAGLYFKAKVGATVGAGIGVPDVAELGAEGEGSLNFQFGISEEVRQYRRVKLQGEASFILRVLGKQVAKKTFAKTPENKGIIYSTFPKDNISASVQFDDAQLFSINEIFENYDINSVYENESREYLKNAFVWKEREANDILLSVSYSNKNLSTLAENIYPSATPQICDMDGTKVLIFTTDDPARSDANKQMLVYSVYDEETAKWLAPQAICDDGTADYYPCIAGDYIVWQNQKSVMDDDLTLAETGKLGEIVLAEWNGSAFDAPISLTDNDALDTMPKIAVNGDEITVVWVKNSEDDIMGISGESSLVKKVYSGMDWSEETTLKQGLHAVISTSLCYCGDQLYLAYSADADGDITTVDDREIYLIAGGETQVTDNEVMDSHPVMNGGKLYWYTENNIGYRELGQSENKTVFADGCYQLAENFAVSENNGNIAILWTGITEEGNEIFGELCQNGEWGDVIQISNLGQSADAPTALLDSNGRILTAFTASDEQSTSLYTIDLFPSYDIAVEDVLFSESGLTADSTNEVQVVVKNTGELPISGYTVTVYNGDQSVNTVTAFDEVLNPGYETTVKAYFETGTLIKKETLTAKVSPEQDEFDESNNSATFEIGHCDLAVTDLASYELLPTATVIATVQNNGFSDAENVAVHLRNGKEDGEIVASETIDMLAASKSQEIIFDYVPEDYDDTLWYVTVDLLEDEFSGSNNADWFINESLLDLANFEFVVNRFSCDENGISLSALFANNTKESMDTALCLAVYDKNGKMKALSLQPFTLNEYGELTVDVSIADYRKTDGDVAKIFVWDAESGPLSEVRVVPVEE